MDLSPAILMRKVSWSETSLIVTWLTREHGKVRTVVRGARRPNSPFAGTLDLFYRADISFAPTRRGDLHELREVSLIEPFQASSAGHINLYLCGYFTELAEHAASENHPCPEIHDLMVRALRHLQDKPASVRALFHFEKELARLIGVLDDSGRLPPVEALATLIGRIPDSRATVFKMLETTPTNSLAA